MLLSDLYLVHPSIIFYSSFCLLFCSLPVCLFTLFSDTTYCFIFRYIVLSFPFPITLFCLLLPYVLLLFNLFSFCYSLFFRTFFSYTSLLSLLLLLFCFFFILLLFGKDPMILSVLSTILSFSLFSFPLFSFSFCLVSGFFCFFCFLFALASIFSLFMFSSLLSFICNYCSFCWFFILHSDPILYFIYFLIIFLVLYFVCIALLLLPTD